MSLRSFGKAAFAVVQSEGARLQLWFKRDVLGPERHEVFKLLQAGDFAFGRGALLRTRTASSRSKCASSACWPRRTGPFPTTGTASPTWRRATASATSTCS